MIPILSAILPLVGDVLDRIVPDKAGNERAKRKIEQTLATAAMKGQLGQLEINKVEAAHRSIFVAGWRKPPTGPFGRQGGVRVSVGAAASPYSFILLSRQLSNGLAVCWAFNCRCRSLSWMRCYTF